MIKGNGIQPTFFNSFSQFPVLWSQHLQRETARPALMNWWSPDKLSFKPFKFLWSSGAATSKGTCNWIRTYHLRMLPTVVSICVLVCVNMRRFKSNQFYNSIWTVGNSIRMYNIVIWCASDFDLKLNSLE